MGSDAPLFKDQSNVELDSEDAALPEVNLDLLDDSIDAGPLPGLSGLSDSDSGPPVTATSPGANAALASPGKDDDSSMSFGGTELARAGDGFLTCSCFRRGCG